MITRIYAHSAAERRHGSPNQAIDCNRTLAVQQYLFLRRRAGWLNLTHAEIQALDPGVRRLVVLLRLWGFETCDSGDGKTKPGAGQADERGIVEVQEAPHVQIQLDDAGDVLERFAELRYLLENVGILVDSSATPFSPMLQGSIGFVREPVAKTTAFLEVWNVDDAHLAPELLAWLDQEIARLV